MPSGKFIKGGSIAKTKDGNFGKYEENTGGGEVVHADSKGSRGAWERGGKKEKREDSQPRTADGKFTYNSANGKPLKEISKVNGKSRGTTVNPVLTGGVNGVHFKHTSYNTEKDRFDTEKWKKWADEHNWYNRGTEIVGYDGKIKLAPERLEVLAQEYIDGKFGYYKYDKYGNKKGTETEDVKDWSSKPGRHADEEKSAIERAKTKGELGKRFVKKPKDQDESLGKYKISPKIADEILEEMAAEEGKMYTPEKIVPTKPEVPAMDVPKKEQPVPVMEKAPEEVAKPSPELKGVKYNSEQVSKLKDLFIKTYGEETANKVLDKMSKMKPESLDAWIESKGLNKYL